ncbi:MAG: hypothetical protein QXI91_07665 [Candidatus Bathyarchaeia archaeon]
MKVKALIVKPPNRGDWDLGDVLAVARSEGKRLFKTHENVRVLWMCETPYGHVVIVGYGCNQEAGCKQEET